MGPNGNGLFASLSESLKPHTEHLSHTLDGKLYLLLRELQEIRLASRPQIHDRWGMRPFAGTTAPIAVAETKPNEILKLQTVYIQFKHKGEKEPLPAFIIQINGMPVYALAPGRILEKEEWGFQSETFGGDLIVPRGSLLEVTPALTGSFEARGAFTFIRNLLETGAANAGFGESGEEFNLESHAGEHEIARDMAAMNLPHTGETRPAGGAPDEYAEGGAYEEQPRLYPGGMGGHPHG